MLSVVILESKFNDKSSYLVSLFTMSLISYSCFFEYVSQLLLSTSILNCNFSNINKKFWCYIQFFLLQSCHNNWFYCSVFKSSTKFNIFPQFKKLIRFDDIKCCFYLWWNDWRQITIKLLTELVFSVVCTLISMHSLIDIPGFLMVWIEHLIFRSFNEIIFLLLEFFCFLLLLMHLFSFCFLYHRNLSCFTLFYFSIYLFRVKLLWKTNKKLFSSNFRT